MLNIRRTVTIVLHFEWLCLPVDIADCRSDYSAPPAVLCLGSVMN